MAQDKDRKELLEEPDPVSVYLHRLFDLLVKYRNQLIAGGIALLAVVMIGSGIGYYLNRAENQAATLFGKAMEQYMAAKEGNGPAPDYGKLKAEFKAILDDYGHTDAADLAKVQYAGVLYDSGDYDGAIAMYREAGDAFAGNARFESLIMNNLAYAYEAKGDMEKAVAGFEKVAADKNAVTRDQALFNLGRLYSQLGKADESRGAYEKILSEYPDSLYAEPAKTKLAG